METTHYQSGSSLYTVVSEPIPAETVKAGFWRRLPAFIIDNIILQILTEIIITPLKLNLDINETSFSSIEDIIQNLDTFIIYGLSAIAIYMTISCLYFTLFHGSTGQTIGKKIMGVKVVPVEDGMMTYRKAFVRYIGYGISEIPLFLGFLWIAFDKNKQGWHDKIAGTYVVKQ
ncbi:MAG: RDD family protein [Nitrospinae bacterium]|nr:RDD family protein [Nitrospinota bacterium]